MIISRKKTKFDKKSTRKNALAFDSSDDEKKR